MFSFNRVTVAGNLVSTPTLRKTPGGTSVTDFTVAVNEAWKDSQGNKQDGVVFVDCTAWGKLAEVLCQHKQQGDGVLVDGRLQQDKWIDKESGKNRSKLKVVADTVKFTGKRQAKAEDQREEERAAKRDGTKAGAVPEGADNDGEHGAPAAEQAAVVPEVLSKEEAKRLFSGTKAK